MMLPPKPRLSLAFLALICGAEGEGSCKLETIDGQPFTKMFCTCSNGKNTFDLTHIQFRSAMSIQFRDCANLTLSDGLRTGKLDEDPKRNLSLEIRDVQTLNLEITPYFYQPTVDLPFIIESTKFINVSLIKTTILESETLEKCPENDPKPKDYSMVYAVVALAVILSVVLCVVLPINWFYYKRRAEEYLNYNPDEIPDWARHSTQEPPRKMSADVVTETTEMPSFLDPVLEQRWADTALSSSSTPQAVNINSFFFFYRKRV